MTPEEKREKIADFSLGQAKKFCQEFGLSFS
jgi:hypothetical protein